MLMTKLVRGVLCVVVLLSISTISAGPAEGEGVTTEEDTAVSITLIGSDPDGDSLTYDVVTGPSNGRLSGTAPKLTYTPLPNFHGIDSFTFSVNDGTVDSVPTTVLIVVTAVNDEPTANDTSVTMQEDTLASITLVGNDLDGDVLTYSVVKGPSYGSLSGTGPNLTYTPNANFNGSDSFLFIVNDGTVDSAAATVSIKLKPVNDPPTASYVGAKVQQNNPPVAKDDNVATEEDTPVSITLEASDPDEDELTYTVVTCPSHGKLSGTAPKLSYTPNPDFNGSDSFTFKVSDETADSNAATVSITVTVVNDAPTANNDSVRTQEDTPIARIDVLTNDTDEDGDSLSVAAVTQGRNGSVTINADNTLSYSPNANFCGNDSFTYTVCDGKGGTDTATVKVRVKAVNDAPTANNDSVRTQEDKPISIRLSGNDPDGDSLSYSVVKGPSHGKLSGTAPKLRYSPKANFNGSDSFTFKTNDKKVDSAAATVSITVTADNDAPKANDNSVITQEDKPVSIRLVGSDPDGDSLTYIVVKGPSHGNLKGMAGMAPKLSYTPKLNFNGSDSFTFKVSDKTVDSAAATVLITVKAVNDAPKANDDSVWTKEDMPIVGIDVLANDTDVDGDPLKISTVTQGRNGSVSIDTDNTLRYAPKANFCGNDSFTYTVYDGKGGTDTATVNVKVKAVNDTPTFTSTPVITATVDTLYTYDVDATDPDAGDTLTYSLTVKPTGMTIDAATGLIQWTPTSAQAGANDVVAKVADSDSVPASNTQPFTITVGLADTPATTAPGEAPAVPSRESKSRDGQTGKKKLLVAEKGGVVQTSDDSRQETSSGLYTSYDFSDIYIPEGAAISSVVVYVEHFEQEQFPEGKLEWVAGTGWPSNPVVWASINAPIYEGEPNEATDLWDLTSFVDTPEKVNSLQLQVKNNDDVAGRKTLVNYIYAVVEWN